MKLPIIIAIIFGIFLFVYFPPVGFPEAENGHVCIVMVEDIPTWYVKVDGGWRIFKRAWE